MSIQQITRAATRRCAVIGRSGARPFLFPRLSLSPSDDAAPEPATIPRTDIMMAAGGSGAPCRRLLARPYCSSSPVGLGVQRGGGGGTSKRGSSRGGKKKTKKRRVADVRRRRGGGAGGGAEHVSAFVSDSDIFVPRHGGGGGGGWDRDDSYDDWRQQDGPKLYYYRDPNDDGSPAADYPPQVRARMKADPTYFMGMDGLADRWTSSSKAAAVPPSRHPAVRSVLKEILASQEQERKQQGGTAGRNGFDGNLIITLPKKKRDSSETMPSSPVVQLGTVERDGIAAIDGDVAASSDKDAAKLADADDAAKMGPAEPEHAELLQDNDDGEPEPESGVTEPTTRQSEKKKDPDAPKKNLTAYVIYGMARRIELRTGDPNLSFGEISKAIGAEWRILSDDERKVWDDRAAADKVRYEEEMEAYENKREG